MPCKRDENGIFVIRFLKNNTTFFLSSICLFSLGFVAILADTGVEVYGYVIGWFAVVIAVQSSIIYAVSRVTRSVWIKLFMAAFWVTINAVSFYLSLFPQYVGLAVASVVLVWIGVFGLCLFLLFAAIWNPVASSSLHAMLVVITVLTLARSLVPGGTPFHPDNAAISPYNKVEFNATPNVHLISVDAMLPERLANILLGIQTEYDPFLKARGALIFKNLFATDVPTAQSISSVMQLADGNFSGVRGFSGQELEPLYAIFKNNGYKIASGYYRGKKAPFIAQGPAVDEYVNASNWDNSVSKSALCGHQGKREKLHQLLGFCWLATLFEKQNRRHWNDSIIEKIASKGDSPEPWLTFHYINGPIQHTDQAYETGKISHRFRFKNDFSRQQKSLFGNWLPTLFLTLDEHDPNAIVFIFGDHGTWLSRTIEFEDNERFFVLDRHGVFGAILPTGNRCTKRDTVGHYIGRYATVERVVSGIIRCLAKNPEV